MTDKLPTRANGDRALDQLEAKHEELLKKPCSASSTSSAAAQVGLMRTAAVLLLAHAYDDLESHRDCLASALDIDPTECDGPPSFEDLIAEVQRLVDGVAINASVHLRGSMFWVDGMLVRYTDAWQWLHGDVWATADRTRLRAISDHLAQHCSADGYPSHRADRALVHRTLGEALGLDADVELLGGDPNV
jgi:hypothetical protein